LVTRNSTDGTPYAHDSKENDMVKCLPMTALVFVSTLVMGQEASKERQIEEALMPLPEALRDHAKVVVDAAPAKRVILRTGENGIICRANTSRAFAVYCYPRALDEFYTRLLELARDGKSDSEIRDALNSDVASGKLEKPSVGAAVYQMIGDSAESSLPHMAIFLPYATTGSTGLSAQTDHYRPWLMWSGTAVAHVMIPGK
jgi:hypothetical protein